MPKITFIAHSGTPQTVDAENGLSLMRAATMRAGVSAHIAEFAPTHIYVSEPNSYTARQLVAALGVQVVKSNQFLCHPDVFAAFAGGIRGESYGAALVSSQHLAQELTTGLSTAELLLRSSTLASANDLLAPARAITPWLRPLNHALRRVLGQPLSLSGSGPTLFLLYPSLYEAAEAGVLVEAAVSRGELSLPDGGVLVTATELAT